MKVRRADVGRCTVPSWLGVSYWAKRGEKKHLKFEERKGVPEKPS